MVPVIVSAVPGRGCVRRDVVVTGIVRVWRVVLVGMVRVHDVAATRRALAEVEVVAAPAA